MTTPRRVADDWMTETEAAGNGRPSAAEDLGRFCADLAWEGMPAEVRERTSQLVLDLIGVAIRGSADASSAAVRAAIGSSCNASGSSAIGVSSRLIPSAAALVNGVAAHAIELDDVTRESSLHPGVAVIPAALAVAEQRGATGRSFLEAIVAGYEVVMRVGNALNPASAYARGFHPTGVAGAFGAAAAAAKLNRGGAATIAHAIAIAGAMASGSMEYLSDGSWTKRLNAGWAAHSGVIAADLAQAGFTGPATALEGERGLLHAYTDAPLPDLLTNDLAGSYQIARVAIKPYACCRYNHGLIDGALGLRADHHIDPSGIRRIRLGVLSAGASLVANPINKKRHPINPVDAQFSAPFAAAVALVHGAAGLPQYRQTIIDDPQIRALMAITDCFTSPELDAEFPGRWPAVVEIHMTDGRVLRTRVEHALGEPENPLSLDALVGKFRDLAGDGLGIRELRKIERLVTRLDEQASVRPIGDLLRGVRAP